ncbi:MAG: L-threonylcarbamoyladenylate synthase, partial [Candidatus Micrarchaeota archaeon]
MTTIKITDTDYESAVDVAHALLQTKGVMVYPTDTVYGIGGDATSDEVVEKILKIKGIAEKRPLSVMVADVGMIDYYCETGLWEDMILGRYLPGPYTFILKRDGRRYIAASTGETLGVRIP